jgi:DNA polymerase-3 subunit epsilon
MGNFATVIIDFETTGLSPDMGDRTIEVGAVFVQNNQILDKFQSLMNPGMRISLFIENEFACSMLSARRIYQDAPNHKLETLVQYKMLKTDGTHHRALADAEMTAHLWLRLIFDIKSEYGLKQVSFQLMQQLGRISKKNVGEFMRKSGLE